MRVISQNRHVDVDYDSNGFNVVHTRGGFYIKTTNPDIGVTLGRFETEEDAVQCLMALHSADGVFYIPE